MYVNTCEFQQGRLYHVFTYIYSLLIEKYIFDRRNILMKLLCVYVFL
jgi:hypothetical protein